MAQLQTFLQRARTDRFFALWVLEATSGMRRCELAGAQRDLLDLAAGTLEIDVTRVVVDGQVIESDGKTENAQHLLALDPFTLAALKAHVEMPDRERKDHGPDYHDHGVLFCWEDGRPPHPDTITRRFKQLAAAAGLPGGRPARRPAQPRHRRPRREDYRQGHATCPYADLSSTVLAAAGEPGQPADPGLPAARPAARHRERRTKCRQQFPSSPATGRVPASTGKAAVTIYPAGQITYADGHTRPAACPGARPAAEDTS